MVTKGLLIIGLIAQVSAFNESDSAIPESGSSIFAFLGERCSSNADCSKDVPNSYCDSSNARYICTCYGGFVGSLDNKRCLTRRETIGDPCTESVQCQVNNAVCSQNICKCAEGFVADPEGKACLIDQPKSLIGKPCDESSNCAGYPYSDCTSAEICACKSNYITSARLDDCLPIRYVIGNECLESQQCLHGALGALGECAPSRNGTNVCKCSQEGVNEKDKNVCLPRAKNVGDDCTIQEQCTVNLGHSHCLQNKCQCIFPAVASVDLTRCLLNDA